MTRPLYVSTAGFKNLKELPLVLSELADSGVGRVELSGGLDPYEGDLVKLLKDWQKQAGFEYIVHNYFPVPREPFILNLAATDSVQWEQSISFCSKSLELSADLGSPVYGVHAGYAGTLADRGDGYFFPKKSVAGIDWKRELEVAYRQLLCAIEILAPRACRLGVKLCIENMFPLEELPPQLLISRPSWQQFVADTAGSGVGLLFDLAHLHIASTYGGENFADALDWILDAGRGAVYQIHFSDNNGLWDAHLPFAPDAWGLRTIRELAQKTEWPQVPYSYESRNLTKTHLREIIPLIKAALDTRPQPGQQDP